MGFISYCMSLSLYIMSSFLMHYSVLYELNTLDACWIAVDVWSNSSRCRIISVYTDVMPMFMIIALDVIITMRFSINCSTVICLPTICFLSREKPLVKPMAPGLFFIIYFQIYKPKNPKIPCCNLFIFTLVCLFIYLLYLSLLDLTLVRDREGIDNPFFALCARVC